MTVIRNIFLSIFSLATLISLTVFAIAGSAGYFSIYGLVLIFSGAVIPVMIMAGSLEVGKLVLTSVLFNYWRKMNWLLTCYCVAAVICLMVITSVGIYGFLSSAYQTNQAPLAQINKRIELLDQEFERKNARLLQMDKVVESISSNLVNQRLKEKRQQDPERKMLQARITEIEKEKLEISSSQLETEVHLGPIVKIAEAFGVTKDRAVHLLIMLFIFVFDPLAVALTLCVNVVLNEKISQRKNISNSVPESSVKINVIEDSSVSSVDKPEIKIKNVVDVISEDVYADKVSILQDTPINETVLAEIVPTSHTETVDIKINNDSLHQVEQVADINAQSIEHNSVSINEQLIPEPSSEICVAQIDSTASDLPVELHIDHQEKTSEKADTDIGKLLSDLGSEIQSVKKQMSVATPSAEDHKSQIISNIQKGQ